MLGINGFYYSEIIKYKRKVRDQLLIYVRDENNEANVTTTINDLVPLFLVDHDNIDKEYYDEEDMLLIYPILTSFINNNNIPKIINKNEAKHLIELAMNKRLTINNNKILATKLAEQYNSHCSNELLLIDMNIFSEVCDSIDGL